jgi:predicted MPP superfamily phosphohydrolase
LAGVFILARLGAPEFWQGCVAGFVLLQIVGALVMMGVRGFGHQPGTGLGRPLLSLLMIWNMLVALPTAGVFGLAALVMWLVGGPAAGADPGSPWRMAGWAAVALPFAFALVSTVVAVGQLNRFRIQRLNISIPHLPPALQGLTIAHLSDLHIGKLTRGKVLDEVVEATNRLEPDLILLTGDLINMSLEDLPRGLELLGRMKSRYGLFLCEGNHDLIEDRKGFETAAKMSGLGFLFNEAATISIDGQVVQILGLRWGEGMGQAEETPGSPPEDALHRLLARRDPRDFTILLAHHPEAFDAAAAAGIPLTLAGHTHGGQLMLSRTVGFGSWLYRYWSGLYRKGESQLVVSNGTGNWFPLRVGAPAEIIFLTLS